MYLRVVQGLKTLVSFMPAYVMTDAEVAERKALLPVFSQVQPLMCYFHMLRGNAEKGVLFQDIGEL
jgi:hypothetical protein